MTTQQVGDLQVAQDTTFEKREWMFQRVGRVFMLLIVLGALLGFFGAGPLSLTEVRDQTGNLTLAYERYGRRGATTELVVDVAPAAIANGKAEVWLSSHYLGEMQVESITPTPDQVMIQDDGYVYTFLVDRPEDPVTATFTFTIDAMGPVTGHAGLAGAEPLELDHFFTP